MNKHAIINIALFLVFISVASYAAGLSGSSNGISMSADAHAILADTVTTNANMSGVINSVGNVTTMAAQTGTGSIFVTADAMTGAMSIPGGNVSQRPPCTGLPGQVRWSTTSNGIEVCDGTNWGGFSTVAFTGAYSDLTGKPTIPAAQVNSDWNAVSGLSQILNKPTLTRTFNYPARSLNSCFQISATNDSDINYSIDVTAAITLGGGTGVATSYTNSGCTTGAQALVNGAVSSVALLGTSSIPLHAILPAGKWVKITTTATGGGTASIDAVQAETILP